MLGLRLRGLTPEIMLLTSVLLFDECLLIREPFWGTFLGRSALKRAYWEASIRCLVIIVKSFVYKTLVSVRVYWANHCKSGFS